LAGAVEGFGARRPAAAAREKAKTKVAHRVPIEVAIVVVKARLYGT
jgi:hypothetical protein